MRLHVLNYMCTCRDEVVCTWLGYMSTCRDEVACTWLGYMSTCRDEVACTWLGYMSTCRDEVVWLHDEYMCFNSSLIHNKSGKTIYILLIIRKKIIIIRPYFCRVKGLRIYCTHYTFTNCHRMMQTHSR